MCFGGGGANKNFPVPAALELPLRKAPIPAQKRVDPETIQRRLASAQDLRRKAAQRTSSSFVDNRGPLETTDSSGVSY